MRVLLTGGGTGGHIVPHASIIDELKEKDSDISFMYIGSSSGLEESFCIENKIPFRSVPTGKLRRYFSLKNLIDIFKIPFGVFFSLYHIRRFNPDVVFSKGGYVALPVVAAAAFLDKKIVIHESDYSPGLATKISARFAQVICVPHENTGRSLRRKYRSKVHVTGNPVRPEILTGSKKNAEDLLGHKLTKPVILVMGGSTGAESLNSKVIKNILAFGKDFHVIHLTGKGKGSHLYPNDKKHIESMKKKGRYFEFEYLSSELKDVYACADLVIARSGAGSVSEMNALNMPVVYVPLSSGASRGDQFENAMHMSETEHIIVNEHAVDAGTFYEKVIHFYKASSGSKVKNKDAFLPAKTIAELIVLTATEND